MINIKEAIDIAYKVSDKTDKFWNFFVIVHFVILGWLINEKSDIEVYYKVAISIVYFSCIAINYFALIKQYYIFHCIMIEVREQAKGDHFMAPEMNGLLKILKFPKRVHLINLVYLVFVFLVMYGVWR